MYATFMKRYNGLEANKRMKGALTDIGFALTRRVWEDLAPAGDRGSYSFCIGGVNAIIAFSAKYSKNEILYFLDHVPEDTPLLPPEEGVHYDRDGKRLPQPDLAQYDEIYMDFNGSMAFFNEEWRLRLSDAKVVEKVLLIISGYSMDATSKGILAVCLSPHHYLPHYYLE